MTMHCNSDIFYRKFLKQEHINLIDIDKWFYEAPESIIIFSKNEKLEYTQTNSRFSKLQRLASPSEIVGMTDYDLCNLEQYKKPSGIQSDDESCMQGKPVHYNSVFLAEQNCPLIVQHKKLPIQSGKKTLGVIVTALNITKQFLNSKTLIVQEKMTLTNIKKHDKIPPKQLASLKLYNQGLPRKTAAKQLNISESTYAWYLREIRLKFDITTRAEMLMLEQHFK